MDTVANIPHHNFALHLIDSRSLSISIHKLQTQNHIFVIFPLFTYKFVTNKIL